MIRLLTPLRLAIFLSLFATRGFAQDAPIQITHGPILGRPAPDSMSLWMRSSQPGKVWVTYGRSAETLDQTSEPAATALEDDNTGIVTLSGLEPDTTYYYQAQPAGPAGSFRTLPSPEAFKHPEFNPDGRFNLRFEFACGNNQAGGGDSVGPELPVYTTMNREIRDTIQFAILNGDWLYEDKREFTAPEWFQQVGIEQDAAPGIVDLDPSIVGVWENYKVYLERGQNLSEWHRHVPSFYTYDDHEALNDIYGTAEAGYVNRRAVFRDIGVRAWFDYLAWANPVEHSVPAHFGRATLEAGSDVLTDESADFTQLKLDEMANLHIHWDTPTAGVKDMDLDLQPGNPNSAVYDLVEVLGPHQVRIHPAAKADGTAPYSIGRRCYGKFSVSNCDFFLLDTRSHRDLHDVKHPDKPGVSMLGKQQLEWLKKGISESQADFIFVVSSVNFMVPHVGSGGGGDINAAVAKDDAWTVFLEEREGLIDFWDALEKPVFVLTGDLHNSFAIKITDNVWEFASGPHNSINHAPEKDEGNRPPNGTFQYGPRPCEIRWSTYVLADIPRANRTFPQYCVVQVNNVFDNPVEKDGSHRWVAYSRPQVIFQYFDAFTGKLNYSETILGPESGWKP